jgi:hypothetical protein
MVLNPHKLKTQSIWEQRCNFFGIVRINTYNLALFLPYKKT